MAYKINLVSSHGGRDAILANFWHSKFGESVGKNHAFVK